MKTLKLIFGVVMTFVTLGLAGMTFYLEFRYGALTQLSQITSTPLWQLLAIPFLAIPVALGFTAVATYEPRPAQPRSRLKAVILRQ